MEKHHLPLLLHGCKVLLTPLIHRQGTSSSAVSQSTPQTEAKIIHSPQIKSPSWGHTQDLASQPWLRSSSASFLSLSLLQALFKNIFLTYVCMHVPLCVPCVCSTHQGQKRATVSFSVTLHFIILDRVSC